MTSIEQLAELKRLELESEAWPERRSLPAVLPKAPSLTPELAKRLLPEAVCNWVLDESHRSQVASEAFAVAILGSFGTVVGRKIGIFPKQFDSFWIPCVFWTAIVARSGERKSSIISKAQKPFEKLEALARQEFKKACASADAKSEVLKAKIENAKDQIKIATKAGNLSKISALECELESYLASQDDEAVFETRYRTNDATVEKLGEMLKGNPAGILHVRDELIGWLKSFDRPGREGDRAFFLEGWDASGAPFSVDRIGRGRVVIESLCLHVMGGIQPGALEDYVRQAVSGGGGDDGFIQRFQLMVYPEQIKSVEWVDQAPNHEAFARIERIFENLAAIQAPNSGSGRVGLKFSRDAQELYQEWSLSLERRFRLGDEEHPAFVSHLSKYLRLMPGLALLFGLIEAADRGQPPHSISLENARRAAAFCEFLESHARKIYAIVERQEVRDADALRRRIERGQIKDGDRIRDIAIKCWAPFGHNADAIKKAVTSVLEPYGWARLETIRGEKGRPSEVIRLNPDVLERGQHA